MDTAAFARLFDHTLLRPDATAPEVSAAAAAAIRIGAANLTVQPHYVRFAVRQLKGSGVPTGTVVGFPHGNDTPATKAYAAKEVIELGADEIDMVMNIPALKDGDQALFLRDVEGVVRAAEGKIVKVITENCYLTQEEKERACEWIAQAGAHFVKTSTGFAPGGATLDDVRLMVRVVRGRCRVKAAGGIRRLEDALAYLQAGAARIGSSRTEELVRAFQNLPAETRAALPP
jgi:deoxyribose-phosphate aldolase